MISTDIDGPIILSSKDSAFGFYYSIAITAFFFGVGVYAFFKDGTVGILALSILLVVFSLRRPFRGETHITRNAIYKRVGYRKYKTFLFSNLVYAFFEDEKSVSLIFGSFKDEDFIISDDKKNYDAIREYFEKVSQKNLPHHGYEIVEKSQISQSDELGCLNCLKIFSYSAVKNWSNEKTGWIKKRASVTPTCPFCQKNGRIIVSRSRRITPHGLQSLSALSGDTDGV